MIYTALQVCFIHALQDVPSSVCFSEGREFDKVFDEYGEVCCLRQKWKLGVPSQNKYENEIYFIVLLYTLTNRPLLLGTKRKLHKRLHQV